MANLYGMFETDENLEQEGIWYNFDEETSFLLARAGGSNMKFAQVLEVKTRPHQRRLAAKKIDKQLAELVNGLYKEAFVEAVLLDWKGVPAKDGSPLSFSKENAHKLFEDLPDLYIELREVANDLANYRVAEIEEDAGN